MLKYHYTICKSKQVFQTKNNIFYKLNTDLVVQNAQSTSITYLDDISWDFIDQKVVFYTLDNLISWCEDVFSLFLAYPINLLIETAFINFIHIFNFVDIRAVSENIYNLGHTCSIFSGNRGYFSYR